MKSQVNKQPADTKTSFGSGSNGKTKGPVTQVTVKYQPGKTVPAGNRKAGK